MVLRNISPTEVDDQLESEMKEECSKYGPVEKVVLFQDKQSTENVLKILVAFVNFAGSLFFVFF